MLETPLQIHAQFFWLFKFGPHSCSRSAAAGSATGRGGWLVSGVMAAVFHGAGSGSGGLNYDIVPGNAAESILVFRMASNDLEVRMPEIGRSIVHPEGVELIAEWINAMAPVSCGAP